MLRRYDDLLPAEAVYAFLALVGFHSGYLATASKVGATQTHMLLAAAAANRF